MVVVGERDGRQSQLSESAREGIDRNEILFTGHIGDSELTWLYKNTRALVFVSFDEGFGMPPVEAAFFGTKSVVSDIPVFRETLQDNAVFVNPNDVQDISRGMRQVCDQPAMSIEPSWWQSKHSWEVSVSRIRHLAMTLAQGRR
ncbi:glycosyltransferase [Pseudonocardia sp. ICBG1142]|uniref:glycosyltransferase n=1 Tax=Pseudonocardia sp. ICBG1142 TaxID=2846760 RepID=UPI002103EE23|nr:glycosyltransferase [Pseudonocardia sp. ICBG1142]